jgi:signal transduction histidine kinase
MLMLARFLLGLFLIGATPVLAQQFSLRNYKAVDGLPQSQINAMVEDGNGYLWLGTNGGGLARFDGREFKVYTTLDGLLSNTVSSLLLDSHQNLWVVHARGVTKFDGRTFKKIHSPSSPKYIWKLYEVGDSIIFQLGSRGTVGKIYKDSVVSWDKPIFPDKRIYFSLRNAHSDICYYLSDSSFLVIPSKGKRERIPFNGLFNSVQSMSTYRSHILLQTDRGHFLFNSRSKKFSSIDIPVKDHIAAYDSVSKTFWIEKNNTLWKQVDDFSKPYEQVIADVLITQLLFDREGNLWIATSGNGLYKYSVLDFTKCGSSKLGSVMAITKDKSHNLWIGSRSLLRMKNGKVKYYPLNLGNPSDVMAIKANQRNEVWVASFSGLGQYDSIKDNIKWFTREHGLTSQYISCIDFDERGNLWCGTIDGGLNYYDGKKFSKVTVTEGLNNQRIHAILYFKKFKKLFASGEYGLDVVEKGQVEKVKLPELASTPIITMSTYKDSLLLLGSSGSGILIFDPVSQRKKSISSKEGLPSNLIYFVAPDEQNFVWVGTEQGISRLRFDKALDIAEIHNYGFDNGLLGVETNQNAYFLGDEKYFGLVDGIYQFNEIKMKNTYSNPVHLTGIDVFYGEVSSHAYADSVYSFFKLPYRPVLPSDRNHITFYFNRVEKQNPKAVRYKYFLENFDKAWSPPTDRGMVTYGNLPPGKYVFQVKAINSKGGWDEQSLQYPFVVKAPFYQTALFNFIVFSVMIGLVVLIPYLSVKKKMRKAIEIERIRQQEQESLRKEIARDFHDDMGNQLTRIINYISLMKLSQNGHASEFYNKVENAAKYLYTGTRDFIWSIDPVNDELSKLFFHIRDFGEKLFEEKGIQFRAYNELKDRIPLPYGFSREANLIMKEAMTNTFNHSQASNVSFTLKETDGEIEMELKDDGKGFAVEDIARTNGLANMKTRASRIKSTVRVVSRQGQGTEVHLLFPELKHKTHEQRN